MSWQLMLAMQAVPAPDPIPLPAPAWLFEVLLVVTFTLHLLAMNAAMGGGVIAAIARLRGGAMPRRLAAEVAKPIPSMVAAAITLGVAALLFVQVLYGQALYTSSVLVAWPWLGALGLLVLGYYGFYRASFRARTEAGPSACMLVGSTLLFLAIAFIYVNNMTLALTPEKWAPMHQADPSGWNLNLDESTLIPRFLHFAVAAVAVGGLFVALLGIIRWARDRDTARILIRHGGRWFMFATMAQVCIGLWWMITLPREQMRLFMGQHMPATIYFGVGFIATLAVIVLMAWALRREDPRGGVKAATGLTVFIIVLMVMMRGVLRDAALADHIRPAEFAVKTQWSPLLIFLALFVGGIGLWVWMLVRYFRSARNAA